MYEAFCVFLCVLAVFGGYVALKAVARAVLRRVLRRVEPCGGDCAECGDFGDCAECNEFAEDAPANGEAKDRRE